jgi:hypothetical protein
MLCQYFKNFLKCTMGCVGQPFPGITGELNDYELVMGCAQWQVP